jgi:hypothetical protein
MFEPQLTIRSQITNPAVNTSHARHQPKYCRLAFQNVRPREQGYYYQKAEEHFRR